MSVTGANYPATMRWLVTGGQGMLAQDVVSVLRGTDDHEVRAPARRELDVLDAPALDEAVQGCDVVVNCAAWTAVDAAETQEQGAFAVNALGAARVAEAAHRHGARVVHLSTDYVFDGSASQPYPAQAPVGPASAYGRTKAAGEWAVRSCSDDALVVRVAWLYGAGGPCFPRTIARASRERPYLEVVDDQVGQPTWTRDVAATVLALVESGAAPGTYHATSSGQTTWFEFARQVVEAAGGDPSVVRPCPTRPGDRPAPRPRFSVLSHDTLLAAGIQPPGPWEQRWATAAPDVLRDLTG